MKNINQWNLIPSLVVIGSCLAASPVAKARPLPGSNPAPKFHGSLTVTVEGGIMAMGGASLGTASMLMLPANAEFVTGASDDFASFRFERGDTVSFSSTMLMPGTQEMLMFPDAPELMVTTGGETFTSVGPNVLHVEAQATVMDMSDPNFGASGGVLMGDFYSEEDGTVRGTFTVTFPVALGTEDNVKHVGVGEDRH
jgi:hypothetical protein